ncbi:MAG TPA: maleylpyruvate isomerase family mycothiol-dependent enzyme [Trebonia sp.]|jgi:maleylpyruvate isomerase|nr:maleylpyruvate isomerase family mycothiol-dependent enzyme [Trebonia sp.]
MKPEQTLGWVQDGTARLRAELAALSDEELDGPTELPGWNRRYLFSHMAANADALRNLVHWARTGEERRMYASAQAREEGIAAGALVSNAELRARFDSAAADLAADFDAMSDENWDAKVITAQGLTRSAREVPWMRVREVYIHAIDLGTGTTFADLPPEFAAALIDEVTVSRSAKGGGPALIMAATDTGGRWDVAGVGAPVPVTAALAELAAYLTGRRAPSLSTAPVLPPWL